jgi:glucans biosynthesis protein
VARDEGGHRPADQHVPVRPEPERDANNFRPALHDSNGLAIHTGDGEWLWRPLNNPKHVALSTFQVNNPRGFGLLQRGREFSSYEDLKDRYDLRPSAWIEPQGDWGKGKVELVEIPTPDETNDNIVAFWTPDQLPPKGSRFAADYTMHWTMDERAIFARTWHGSSRRCGLRARSRRPI